MFSTKTVGEARSQYSLNYFVVVVVLSTEASLPVGKTRGLKEQSTLTFLCHYRYNASRDFSSLYLYFFFKYFKKIHDTFEF